MTAHGLATTLFVLGMDEGLHFIEEWTNEAAIFIARDTDGRFQPVLSSRFTQMPAFRP